MRQNCFKRHYLRLWYGHFCDYKPYINYKVTPRCINVRYIGHPKNLCLLYYVAQ